MPVTILTSCLCFFFFFLQCTCKACSLLSCQCDVKFTECNWSSLPAVPVCGLLACLCNCACRPGPHWVCLPDWTALSRFHLSLPTRLFVPLPPQCRNTSQLHELCLRLCICVCVLFIFWLRQPEDKKVSYIDCLIVGKYVVLCKCYFIKHVKHSC